jgi:hypothetical protein
MFIRKFFPICEEAGAGGGGGAAAPAAAPVAAPTPAPAPAEGTESLLKPPAEAAAPAAPAPAPAAFTPDSVPEKFRVMKADGSLDLEASFLKQSVSYGELSKKLGGGGGAPAAPAEYAFQMPEAMKDLELDPTLTTEFKDIAHKHGLTQEQYQAMVEVGLKQVPGILNSVLKLSADEARGSLQKAWGGDYEKNLGNAQRAIDAVGGELGKDMWARFGRDPAFLQFAAKMGSDMREDKAPVNNDGSGGGPATIDALMASDAYRNPKNPDHARVSAQVQAHHKRVAGE